MIKHTANHAGAAASGHDNGAGVLAGDWSLHNAAISYGAISGRNDVPTPGNIYT